MRSRWTAGVGALWLGLVAAIPSAAAETATLRVMRAVDLIALPLLVMQHENMIERVAEQMGLGAVKVEWVAQGKTNPAEALAAGQADLAAAAIGTFLVAADSTTGSSGEVRALAALTERPYVLVARKAGIATIRDFHAGDHIAVPALKTSGPALMLEMAAAQEWGTEHWDKLDPLLVARSDEAAMEALQSGKGNLDAHFSQTPYADDELASAGVHRVMDSFDVAGPHSAAMLAATTRFHDANPKLCLAILSALEQADDVIRQNPGSAAEIYASFAKDQDIAVEDLTDMIGDPDLAYRTAPSGLTRLAEFMSRVGRLKHKPESWKDLFFPEARDLPGS
ncbi:MAG TPA: ABC transporter substrate-binding protein [Stellaceae bacterium]